MPISTLHYLAPVSVGATAIGGVTDTENPLENQIRDEPLNGELTARIQSLVAQGYSPSFTTHDIQVALAKITSLGCALASNNLKLFARLGSADGRRESSGHASYTYQHGLLLPQSLDCQHQGDASLSCRGLVTYDGVHAPLVVGTAALPTISTTNLWTISSCVLAGVTIPQLRSVRIDFGIRATAEGSDSDIWPTKASIEAVQPVISVTSSRIQALLALTGATGTVQIVLRKRADGGTFSGHTLTLSGSGMATFSSPFRAGGGRPGEATLEARLKYDGVNDPITVS